MQQPALALMPTSRRHAPIALRSHLPRLAALVAAATLVCAPPPRTSAQNVPAPQPARPADPGVIELADEPFRIESVGLTMFLPSNSTAQTSRVGSQVAVDIVPKDSTWIINIQTPQSSNTEMTLKEVADSVAEQYLQGDVGIVNEQGMAVSSKSLILSRDTNLTINGRPAERFYALVPQGQDQPSVVHGYTVFGVGPGRFVTFSLRTTAPQLESAKRFYETTIGTATFTNPGDLAAARGAAIQAGDRLLTQIDSEVYREILGDSKEKSDRWERLYQPAEGGADSDAEEIAYRRVRTWYGRRGELDPSREPKRWTASDRAEGYLVRIDARFLNPDYRTTQIVNDLQGLYFLSPDRQEEAWTLQMTQREGKSATTWTMTGARAGAGMNISTKAGSDEAKGIKPFVPPEGYLSQVETLLLPQLLIKGGIPGDYGFYTYQPEFENIRFRKDSLDRPDGPGGPWKVTTTLVEDRSPQISLFTETGDLIRTELADGRRWEPIELDRLFRLWRSKNLPTE